MAEVKTELKLNLVDQVQKESKRLSSMEETLGLGLDMPFNNTNSSSRKLMYGIHKKHALGILHPEPPLLSTGYENRFGEKSSTFQKAKSNYEVIAKIDKFSFAPNEHYYLVIRDLKTNAYDVIERVAYDYVTEDYGILFNNDYLDKLTPGTVIPEETVVKKSLAVDDYNNRQDGRNMLTAYMSLEHTKEDAIVVSDVAAKELAAPLIKKIPIVINDNDIPLNLYGNEQIYKALPDIGETTKHGMVCALRRRNKDESLFSESYYRLRDIMMSDTKYLGNGKVIDINIYCNNPDTFENYTDAQLKAYYDESTRFTNEVVSIIQPIMESGVQTSYDLQKLYYTNKRLSQGTQYIKERQFSNIYMEVIVLEERLITVGDKLSNRYGGKGCVSKIVPQSQMPRLDNGKYVDFIYNSSGVYNRENAGQLFEMSLNFIGQRILDYADHMSIGETYEAYCTFLNALIPNECDAVRKYVDDLDEDEFSMFVDSITSSKGIYISLKPISESITIDDLNRIYKTMEEAGYKIEPYHVAVPQTDSNGNIRYVKTRRTLVCGMQYIYRLKQYAEEKFSVTSLSSTNIKNENSKSSNKKFYKSLYTQTPIKFGEMETGDLAHIGMENVIINLMLTSVSPHGRRLMERLLTDDPFDINVKIDDEATNRGAEILNTYLFTMGLRLKFIKKKKELKALFKRKLFKYNRTSNYYPKPLLKHIHPAEVIDKEKYLKRMEKELNSLPPLLVKSMFIHRDEIDWEDWLKKWKER